MPGSSRCIGFKTIGVEEPFAGALVAAGDTFCYDHESAPVLVLLSMRLKIQPWPASMNN